MWNFVTWVFSVRIFCLGATRVEPKVENIDFLLWQQKKNNQQMMSAATPGTQFDQTLELKCVWTNPGHFLFFKYIHKPPMQNIGY